MAGGQGSVVLVLLLAGVRVGVASSPFLEEPTNGSASLGEEAELRCAVRGGGAVQWARGGLLLGALPGPAHPRYHPSGDPARGQHHLRILGVALEDDDVFECQVGEGNGTAPRASRPALLTVLVRPGPPRLELPAGAELPWVGGAEVLVHCLVPDARPPARVTLSLGGRLLADVTTTILEGSHPKLSSSEATVRLTPQREAHGQRLVCEATNEAGPAPAPASLTLDVLFPHDPPTIEGLESPHVRAGDTLRLVCVVRGGNPLPSLHWEKDGTPLASHWLSEGRPPTAARSRLTLTVTPEDDGATLRCSARGPLPPSAPGGASASITLSVTYPPAEVTITGSPVVAENGTVTLSCTSAPSNPPVRLRWWLGGRELAPSDTTHTPAEGRGWVTVANVTVLGQRGDHGRPLVCEGAAPRLGTRSTSLVLSVTHPPQELWLEAPPPNATFRAGERLRLGCHARGGHPSPRLTWSKDGRPLKDGSQVSGGSVTSRELLVTLTPGDNGATYRCEAGGDPRSPSPPLSAHTRLRVLFPPPSVTIVATPPEARPGQRLELKCQASGHPSPHLRWHRRGDTVPGDPLPSTAGPFGGVTVTSRLSLRVALSDQGDLVTCEATSPLLAVAVSAAHRLQLRHPPHFSVGEGELVVAREHEGVQLPVTVLAHPPVESCTWTLAGRPLLPEGSPRHQLLPGGGLAIANVTRGDAGTYGLECHNREGSASARLHLRVHYPPSIVWAPDPVVVGEGGSAELLCRAQGSPLPPGCLTWGRLAEEGPPGGGLPPELTPEGGVPLGRLRVRGAGRHLAGPYECRVDTGVPPPARAIVRLVVRYGPELEAAPDPQRVLVPEGEGAAQLRCRARGVPGVRLHWEHRGRPLQPGDTRFQEHQWREGPWTSTLLTVANITQDRARLRHQFYHFNWNQYNKPHRYQYHNWDQFNWDEDQNGTLGTFVCVAQNPLGTIRRHLQLWLAERPDPPHALVVSGATPTSLRLAWAPGFPGGLPQHFLVSVKGPGAPPPPTAILAPGPALTVGGLLPATTYDVTVRARNSRGDSAPVVIRGVTSELPQDSLPVGEDPIPPPAGFALPSGLVWGLSALGGVLLLGNAALGGALWWRRHFREEARGPSPTPPSKEGSANQYSSVPNQYSPVGPESLELSSFPSDPPPWDPLVGELHPYEDVAEWGGYEEVAPPDLRFTPEGELV